ncbi:MAG: outer membrane protein assembly factor BamD [Bacteroidia bacterium]
MLKRIHIIFFILVLAGTFSSCSKYNKMIKNADISKKYEIAIDLYNKGDYVRALPLFEELMTVYKGTDKAETVYYYYAYTNYNLGDYVLGGYYFHAFAKTYPNSPHTEECEYMYAYCYYLNSPTYSLDQSDTKTAIQAFQEFANQFPNSDKLTKCNQLIDNLRAKLQRKAYENAKLYYYIEDYKAAIVAFKNVLKDYPDIKQKEEINFLIVKSNYLLAINSIDLKKPERLQNTVSAYLKYVDMFPQGAFLKDAEQIYNSALKEQQKIKKQS